MLFIAFTIFLGEIGNPKRGNGLEGGSGVRPATSWAGATVAELGDHGILGCWFLTHLNYFWRVTWGLLAFRSPGFGGLGFGVWIWVSGFRGVWGLVLHRRLRWFARGLLARRRTTPKGDSPGGGFSPGGGHSTTDVQSKAVDQNQVEKSPPPGAGALRLKAKSSFSGRGHPFLPGRRGFPIACRSWPSSDQEEECCEA